MSDHEEFSISYEKDGREIIREMDKAVLSKGAWATVMFLYQERGRKSEEWGSPKVRIQRYRKVEGSYRTQTKFNISSARQAGKIVEILRRWYELED